MKAILISAVTLLLMASSCKKGRCDMTHCKNDPAMCRSMCAKMLNSQDGVEVMKSRGMYVKSAETGEMDKEATLNKMMEMCTQNQSFCREVCGKMMHSGGMMGMISCQ